MAISCQRVAAILGAKGFRAGDASPESPGLGYIVETRPGGVIEVWCWGAFITSPARKAEYARAYLAALSAAGIRAHLADDGRTVVVPVEQEGLGGQG